MKASNTGTYRDIWSEIVIQAPPAKVRATFLDFEKRPYWDPFIRKIGLTEGRLDDLTANPRIGLTINAKADGIAKNDFTLPFTLPIYKRDDKSIIWGCNW